MFALPSNGNSRVFALICAYKFGLDTALRLVFPQLSIANGRPPSERHWQRSRKTVGHEKKDNEPFVTVLVLWGLFLI